VKYRSRTDIVAEILESANGGVTKTKIMYKAFLSYTQLQEYVSLLIENGLLEYHPQNQIYKTTAKGNHFMRIYDRMEGYIITHDRPTKL
jgi:predicted transcriptional regulator